MIGISKFTAILPKRVRYYGTVSVRYMYLVTHVNS